MSDYVRLGVPEYIVLGTRMGDILKYELEYISFAIPIVSKYFFDANKMQTIISRTGYGVEIVPEHVSNASDVI